jgi:flagellar biosynthesis/type III secretory pathway protein FliH
MSFHLLPQHLRRSLRVFHHDHHENAAKRYNDTVPFLDKKKKTEQEAKKAADATKKARKESAKELKKAGEQGAKEAKARQRRQKKRFSFLHSSLFSLQMRP